MRSMSQILSCGDIYSNSQKLVYPRVHAVLKPPAFSTTESGRVSRLHLHLTTPAGSTFNGLLGFLLSIFYFACHLLCKSNHFIYTTVAQVPYTKTHSTSCAPFFKPNVIHQPTTTTCRLQRGHRLYVSTP